MEPEIKVSEKPESQPKANMLRQLILINFMFFRKKYKNKKTKSLYRLRNAPVVPRIYCKDC